MNSVLITGGTGTLGQALTERLLSTDNTRRICIFSRSEKEQSVMALKYSDVRLRFFIGDVRDRWRLRRAADGCDVVIHAAALKRIEVGVYNPDEMVKTNVLGSANVIEAARDAGVQRCVLVSTDKAFQPISSYGHSKALGESLFLAGGNSTGPAGPRFSVVRYGNVWGSAGSVGPLWRSIIARGLRPGVSNPECTRFFMLLSEAVDFVLGAVNGEYPPGMIAVPTWLPAYRLGDLLEAMEIVDYKITGLPWHEKLHEGMCEGLCSKDARRMTIEELRSHL